MVNQCKSGDSWLSACAPLFVDKVISDSPEQCSRAVLALLSLLPGGLWLGFNSDGFGQRHFQQLGGTDGQSAWGSHFPDSRDELTETWRGSVVSTCDWIGMSILEMMAIFPSNSTSSWFWSVKLMKLIRPGPKWDFNFLKCGTPVPDFHLITSKVSEAWLSHPVLRTTLLCWILKGDNGWKRRKNSGDGKGPCDRAVEQSKLQTYAKIKRQVSSMITLWLYILCHGSWIRIYWQLMAIG